MSMVRVMEPSVRGRVAHLLGVSVVDATPVVGGFTPAARWRVLLTSGLSVFVKMGTTAFTANALRDEYRVLETLPKLALRPVVHGFDAHAEQPLLILEDLSAARWPPPWRDADLQRIRATIAQLEMIDAALPELDCAVLADTWDHVAKDPAPLLSLGLCSAEWLDAALPVLQEASHGIPTEPAVTLHQDLRSDNLCLFDERVVFVDWNCACRGPRGLDLAFMAPSVRLEGGPLPDVFTSSEEARFAPWVAGYFASCAPRPNIRDAPRVRRFQTRQLRMALPWVARVLGLPPPSAACYGPGLPPPPPAPPPGPNNDAPRHHRAP